MRQRMGMRKQQQIKRKEMYHAIKLQKKKSQQQLAE